jgi:hypothetical protein
VARGALTRTAIAALFLATAAPLPAQSVEIAPFVGMRAGGDDFDLVSARPGVVDHDPVVGVVVDVPMWEGLQIEGLFSHEPINFTVYVDPYTPGARLHGAMDHWQAGALQEFGRGAIRPFLSGVLGLTRFAIEADAEYRFAVGGGGGVKIFPTSRVGVRLDGRVFATFLDATTSAGICGGAGCILGIHIDTSWQFEMTAGVVVRIGRGA